MNQFQKTRSTQQLGSHATAAMAACRTIMGGLGRTICLCAVCSLGEFECQKERKERIKNNFFTCCILTCVKPNKSKNARRPETHHHVQHPATSCNIVQHCRCRFLNLSQLQVCCSDFCFCFGCKACSDLTKGFSLHFRRQV